MLGWHRRLFFMYQGACSYQQQNFLNPVVSSFFRTVNAPPSQTLCFLAHLQFIAIHLKCCGYLEPLISSARLCRASAGHSLVLPGAHWHRAPARRTPRTPAATRARSRVATASRASGLWAEHFGQGGLAERRRPCVVRAEQPCARCPVTR